MTSDPHPPAASRPVAVVIPHLDRLRDTADCCRSLAAQSPPPALVIVVDNASAAHGEAELAAACPAAKILRLPTNHGFAGGVNAGIRLALADPAIEFVWVLNNDTVCPPGTLDKLLAATADPQTGLVGSPLLEGSAPADRRVVPAGKNLAGPWKIPVWTVPGKTPGYLSGASLLIRRGLLEDIGLFDEGFFFFFEDADLSRRAVARGWRLAVAADALVEHRGSSTIRHLGRLQAQHYRAGHVRYLRKHARHPLAAALPPFLFRLAAEALALRFDALRGNAQGWRDGWRTPIA